MALRVSDAGSRSGLLQLLARVAAGHAAHQVGNMHGCLVITALTYCCSISAATRLFVSDCAGASAGVARHCSSSMHCCERWQCSIGRWPRTRTSDRQRSARPTSTPVSATATAACQSLYRTMASAASKLSSQSGRLPPRACKPRLGKAQQQLGQRQAQAQVWLLVSGPT